MSKLFHCEIEYMPSPHLMQLYTGFFELQKLGLVDLVIKRKKYVHRAIPVINAIVNKKYKVIYDTQDGLCWINNTEEENLKYFQQNYPVDFYFKRSFHQKMLDYKPKGCNVHPLGFNYNVHPNKNLLHLTDKVQDKLKYFIKTNRYLKLLSGKKFFYAKDFEFFPIKPEQNKILFLTRVWDPKGEDVFSTAESQLRETINSTRIMCLEACKKEFGDRFTGGLYSNRFSYNLYKEHLLSTKMSSKSSFLKRIKEHSICIGTTGLDNSIGWKMGEYVAASRAIISEPLNFELPGSFENGKNYLEFTNQTQLLESIHNLLCNNDLMMQMMKNNYYYYTNYLKPENLVLNTLLTIIND